MWPKLKPIIALHLSDSDGAPMHAKGNGWYWLAGYYGGAGQRYHGGNGERQHWKDDGSFDGYRVSTSEECLRIFAELMRIDIEAARKVAEVLRDPTFAWEQTKEALVGWIEAQRPRWKLEAEAGVALLDRLIAEQKGEIK